LQIAPSTSSIQIRSAKIHDRSGQSLNSKERRQLRINNEILNFENYRGLRAAAGEIVTVADLIGARKLNVANAKLVWNSDRKNALAFILELGRHNARFTDKNKQITAPFTQKQISNQNIGTKHVDNFHRQVIESHHDFPSARFNELNGGLDDAVFIRRYSVFLEEIFVSDLPVDILIEDILARKFFLLPF
jgi:hypothetical protein